MNIRKLSTFHSKFTEFHGILGQCVNSKPIGKEVLFLNKSNLQKHFIVQIVYYLIILQPREKLQFFPQNNHVIIVLKPLHIQYIHVHEIKVTNKLFYQNM